MHLAAERIISQRRAFISHFTGSGEECHNFSHWAKITFHKKKTPKHSFTFNFKKQKQTTTTQTNKKSIGSSCSSSGYTYSVRCPLNKSVFFSFFFFSEDKIVGLFTKPALRLSLSRQYLSLIFATPIRLPVIIFCQII